MIGSAAAPWPTDRTLADWLRVLVPWHPRTFWVGQLEICRVEALVQCAELVALDPFAKTLLLALDRGGSGPDLARRLGLTDRLLCAGLNELRSAQLVVCDATGTWSATPLGRQARRDGTFTRLASSRRSFTFVVDGPSTQFLPLHLPPGTAAATEAAPGDAVAWLRDGIARPDQWKQRRQFPTDVQAVIDLADANRAEPDWRRVPVVAWERVTVALIETGQGADAQVLGLAARPDGSLVVSGEPALCLTAGSEVFPELAAPDDPGALRSAWVAWGRQHGLADVDLFEANLKWEGLTIRATVSAEAREKLVAAGGETWLLVGEGSARRAGRVGFGAD